MKKLPSFLVAAAVLLGVSLPDQAEERAAVQKPPDTGTPTRKWAGTVTDAAGKPVAGATVEYWSFEGNAFQPRDLILDKKVTTGTDGVYEFILGSQNPAFLVARKSGLAPGWLQLDWTFGLATETEQKLVMTPPGALAGVVVDESDKPVANAEVSVTMAIVSITSDNGFRSFNYLTGKPLRELFVTRTDASGHFKIQLFPTNAYASFAVQFPGKALRPPVAREFVDPETWGYRAGEDGIKLVVEPVGSVEGLILGGETNQSPPVARLTLQPEQGGRFGMSGPEPVQSGADGVFRLEDVAAGGYQLQAVFGTNAPADWVADPVPVSVEMDKTTRGVQVTATRGGLLEVTVLGKNDRKPLPQIIVTAYGQRFQSSTTSDTNGLARLRLLPGDYQLLASQPNVPGTQTTASVEAGQTVRTEMEVAPPKKISGIVRTPDGQPAAGVAIRLVGSMGGIRGDVKTDANGKFELPLSSRSSGPMDTTPCLLVRDPEHNLAVAHDVDEDTGPLELKLVPALTLAGRAESDGKPVTNVTASLVFWTSRSGLHLPGLARTNAPGQYEIPALPPGRKYGVIVSAPGYGQVSLSDIGASADATRQELDTVELKPANLRLAGQVLDADDKPVAGCYVNLQGEGQPRANVRTDRAGRFTFAQVCEGTARLFANSANSFGNISAEGGETNVILRLGQTFSSAPASKTRQLTGTVMDAEGKPAGGAQVAVVPSEMGVRWVKAGTNGVFNLNWSLRPWQSRSGGALLVARDIARKLAATAELPEETTNLDVKLKPALTLTGQVRSADEAPLAGAQIDVQISAGGRGAYDRLNEQPTSANAEGHFEIGCLPSDVRYLIIASAKGHGQSQQTIEPDPESTRMELAPFVLKLADRVLAGRVLNEKEKPVSGVNVSINGTGQPSSRTTTDSKGQFRFQVCEGPVRLFASAQDAYAQASAEAGDTNVVMTLSARLLGSRQSPPRATLKGRPLPDLAGVNLAGDAVLSGEPVLLCLFDAGQRPSRFFMRQLNERAAALQQKNICVIGVQAAVTGDEIFNDWKSASPVSFPVGRLTEKSVKSKWVSTVTALPWLILTDARHQVIAEGFAFDELDAQIQKLEK